MKKVIIFIVTILVVVSLFFIMKNIFFKKVIPKKIVEKDMYIASSELSVQLFDLEYNETEKIARGTKVKVFEKDLTNENNEEDNNTYIKISYDEKE